jgi:hypothetical protein
MCPVGKCTRAHVGQISLTRDLLSTPGARLDLGSERITAGHRGHSRIKDLMLPRPDGTPAHLPARCWATQRCFARATAQLFRELIIPTESLQRDPSARLARAKLECLSKACRPQTCSSTNAAIVCGVHKPQLGTSKTVANRRAFSVACPCRQFAHGSQLNASGVSLPRCITRYEGLQPFFRFPSDRDMQGWIPS